MSTSPDGQHLLGTQGDNGSSKGNEAGRGSGGCKHPPTLSISQLLTLYLGWDPIAMATRAYWLIGLL